MEFDKVIEKRHSSKSFKDKSVSWKLVLEAIDAAIKAPMPGNHLHVKFVIIEDPKKIDKLAEFANQTWINQAPILIAVVSDDTHLENQYGGRGRVYSRQTAGAIIENLTLKLIDLGLNSCWVGSFTDELVKQELKVPSHMQVEALIPVGHEKDKAEKKKRTALENVLRWEDWNTWRRQSLFTEPSIRKETLH